jgi:osmoprotectant transport system permease protein
MTILAQTLGWLGDPGHWQGPGGIPARLLEHVALAAVSLLIALAIALPAGLAIGHTRRGAAFAINVANVGRALPTLAVIGIVLPLTAAIDPQLGFKVYPTLIAMVLLAVPLILVNTYAGVAGVDADLVEAARGMGMDTAQLLRRVEIPVALPVIAGGVRSAAVLIVATATIGAIFGSGGLGRFLVEGIAQNDDGMIFGGAVLVAGLAVLTDFVFGALERALTSPGLATAGTRREAAGPTSSR